MKFRLADKGYGWAHADSGNWDRKAGRAWFSERYCLSIRQTKAYELSLCPLPSEVEEIDIPGMGKAFISVGFNIPHIRMVFLTKVWSAAIIIACKIMKALEDVQPEDLPQVEAAMDAVAAEYGGSRLLSEVCGLGLQPEEDNLVCMLDDYFRSKHEKDE